MGFLHKFRSDMLKFCHVWARMKINENEDLWENLIELCPFSKKKLVADKENKFLKFQLYLYVT